ncbi:Hypothetical predicted protein [Olea europaea subsp. europaea]|uniref:Uncharacterized protein n=1 Tax=Olea europaea subsp. europaea TaxID=158383 RepID=A0A8S0RMX5_OLEEU|nr:Hypothetical predicted protein [Olea europaea subsp. europaea]
MDQTGQEKSSASSSELSLEKGLLQTQQSEAKFSSPTPMKAKEPSRIKCKEEASELPEKLKYWQGVQIDKILVHDEQTKCMKPDVKIALVFDVIEGRHGESVFMELKNLLSSRLKKLYVTHPKDLDIPEAVLPEPFNRRSIKIKVEPTPNLSALPEMEVSNSSHLSPSFCKRFSQKTVGAEKEQIFLLSPIKSSCVANHEIEETGTFTDPSSKSTDILQVSQTSHSVCSGTFGNTPMKLAFPENDNLIVKTPAQSNPIRLILANRSVLTGEDESKTATSENCTPGSLTVKRSLDFYSLEGDSTSLDFTTYENEMEHSEGVCSTLPQMKMEGCKEKLKLAAVFSFKNCNNWLN